ncbi:MAG TPA: hypothetical protein VM638_01820, partial [Actinomycetota bacterium]|nr:hypothetical protein [Actinomycetota bacterium]
VAEGSGSDLSLTVADGEQVTCTITNIRKTGKIEVVKALEPADDPGEFELLIQDGEGSMVGSTGPVGHHGSTGSVELPTGTYTVAERAGGASSLGDYHSDISCDPRQGDAGALALSEGDATVVLGSGDDVVCTITNTRKTGRIEVVKVLEPAGDPGEFDLFIEDSEGSTVGSTTPVGHLGSTGPVQIPTGTYTVGERAAPGTSLDDYGRGIVCGPREGDGAGALGDSGDGPVQDEIVTVADGDDILCTITNTRLGSITVTTETDPADARSANFTYSGTGTDMPQHLTLDTAADDDTNPSTFMVAGLLPGSYSISATDVPAGWTLQGLECVGGDGTSADAGTGVASIELSGGEDVECTFSHGRTPLSGTVVKTNDADLQGAFSHQEVASAAGQSVRFQLVITNTSPVPVTIEAIKDTFAGSTVDVPECLDASAANAVGMELSRGGSDGDAVTCRFTLARYAPASNSQLLNTAGVVLRDEFSSFSVTDTSVVTTPELPAREDDDDDDTRDSGNGIDNDARPALLAEEPQRPGGLALTGVRLWFLLLFSLALMVAGFAAREKAGSEA